jgi:AcrR family transcriptional regulator
MPGSSGGEETRQRLVDAAAREFAENGVHTASLLEVTRQAGQRNRGARHYHYGTREGLLVAVLEEQVQFLAQRERELLAAARERPGDLASAVEAFVRPSVELADQGPKGRCYLMILCELVEDDPDATHRDVRDALERAGGYEAFELFEERMPAMPDHLRAEPMSLATSFILRAGADRARAAERDTPSRPQLPAEEFIATLVSMGRHGLRPGARDGDHTLTGPGSCPSSASARSTPTWRTGRRAARAVRASSTPPRRTPTARGSTRSGSTRARCSGWWRR